LRDVAERSSGRFRPTSVAGYERGERAISLERFCDLCEVLEISPERTLIEVLRALGRRAEPAVDLTALLGSGEEETGLVAGFVRQVLAQRGERHADRVVLRAGDVEVLASASGIREEDLLERFGRSRPTEPTPTDRATRTESRSPPADDRR
jgi:transcriptional regulator with XRE-family HTH domain